VLRQAYRWLLGAACLITLYRLKKVLDGHAYALARDDALAASITGRTAAAPELRLTPRVSALVAAWNPGEDLEGLVASFEALDYPDKELILAAGGAHAIERMQDLTGPTVRLIPHPGGGKQRALQACLQHATGDVIFLTDADCVIEPDCFLSLIAPIVNGESSVTTGRHIPLAEQQEQPFVQLQWARSMTNFAHVPEDTGVFGANCALTRAALEAAGGFSDSVSVGTDVHLSSRLHAAGYHVRYVYESQVQTHYHDRLLPYLRQRSRWLRNQPFIAELAGDEATVRAWRKRSLEVLGFLALTALLPLRRRPLLLLLAVPLAKRYLEWRRLLRFGERLRRRPWRLPPVLGALLGLYAEGVARALAFVDYLLPSRRRRW
jgi:cellulose synthase/poly-beta-1,6-N-acetylglucosamine synthase-like glycosyltransferase